MPLKASLLRLCMEIVQFMFTVKRSFIYRVDIKYCVFWDISLSVSMCSPDFSPGPPRQKMAGWSPADLADFRKIATFEGKNI